MNYSQAREIEVDDKERLSDTSDRATAEEMAFTQENLDRVRQRAQRGHVPPRDDGDCACGCGNPVNPARLALGYGLTIECAARRERS